MARFYISDGARPGSRIPAAEFRTSSGRTSDVLNEAQAITRRRKLTRTVPPPRKFRIWRVLANSWIYNAILANPDVWLIGEMRLLDDFGADLSSLYAVTPAVSSNSGGSNASKLHDGSSSTPWQSADVGGHPNTPTPQWAQLSFVDPQAVKTVVLEQWPTATHYTCQNLILAASNDGSNWTTIQQFFTTAPADPYDHSDQILDIDPYNR